MILGLGTDIVNISRIERILFQFSERFTNRILSKSELEEFRKEVDRRGETMEINDSNVLKTSKNGKKKQAIYLKSDAVFFAKKFAAKEALAKALGVGIGRGVNFKDITIRNDELGKPYVELDAVGARFLEERFGVAFSELNIHISLSDDRPFANAVALVERT